MLELLAAEMGAALPAVGLNALNIAGFSVAATRALNEMPSDINPGEGNEILSAATAPTLTTSPAQANVANMGLNAAPTLTEPFRNTFRPKPLFTTYES
jgi:hypothetical protein